MILEGKRIVVTGVLTEASIAFSVARMAQEQGADVALTSFGRARRLTEHSARRLPRPAEIYELDVTQDGHFEDLTAALADRWGGVDGVLHAIGFAPETCLGGEFLAAGWDDVAVALRVSAYSLKALAGAVLPLMKEGGSIVALDFDARQSWPSYDWMGVAKAALESVARYLARDLGSLGVRVNLVSAGPLQTMAARGVPGFHDLSGAWADRAPMGWNSADADPVAATCVALLSDWLPVTTGEIVHADGGFHSVASARSQA